MADWLGNEHERINKSKDGDGKHAGKDDADYHN
jgi:hypothetical protein